MNTKTIFLACLLLFAHSMIYAQYDFKALDAWLSENTPKMGGRSILLIYKDGQIIYNHAEKNMNGRQKIAVKWMARRRGETAEFNDYTPTTKEAIASCSKWLSAALVMSFVDEGALQLEDTVGKYLPVLSVHGKGSITIGQCLSHLTGIEAPPLPERLKEMKKLRSMDESIEQLADLPMEGRPGSVFHYSNEGLQIAGAILEKISGKSFETLFAERIAGPLHMQNTDFGYGPVPLPAGGATSTPADYLNFLVMILQHGLFEGKRVLSEHSIALMQENRVVPGVRIAYSPGESAGITSYGFGEWIFEKSVETGLSRTLSSPGLFGSFPWIDNDKKYAAFLMTFYLDHTGRIQRYVELKRLVDQALEESSNPQKAAN